MTASSPDRRRQTGAAVYWLCAAHLWTVFGLAASNVLLGLGLLTAAWHRRSGFAWYRYARVLTPLALYLATLGAAIVASHDAVSSLPQAREALSLATLPLVLVALRGFPDVRRVCDGLAVVAAASALYGLGELLVSGSAPLHRIQGPFSHYMTLAGFLLLADLLLMARLACDAAARRAFWRWALLVPINLAMVATMTRGAWVALFLGFSLLLLVRVPRYLSLFLATAVLVVAIAPHAVRHRVLSTFDPHDVTNYDRLCMLEAGMRMVAHHPFTGIGPGMVDVLYPIYRHPTAPQQSVPHLHNATLQLSAERGLVALAAYLWLMGGAIVLAYRRYRATRGASGPRSGVYLGIAVALVAFNIAGLFEDNWSDTELQRIALFLIAVPHALAVTVQRVGRETIDPVSQHPGASAGEQQR